MHGRPKRVTVAQIGNLLYRRMEFGRVLIYREAGGLPIRDTAGCQPALLLPARLFDICAKIRLRQQGFGLELQGSNFITPET
jgi:hypothetical protein